MIRQTIAAAALFLVLPVGLAAQQHAHAQGHQGHQGHPHAERVIEHRAELGLTDAQVAEIERIAAEVQARNAPLQAQMREHMQEARGERQQMTPEQRRARMEQMRERRGEVRQRGGERRAERGAEARGQRGERAERGAMMGRQIPEDLQPVMAQLRENNQAAMQAIRGVLTEDQQTRLRELHREHMSERRAEMRERRGDRPERQDRGQGQRQHR